MTKGHNWIILPNPEEAAAEAAKRIIRIGQEIFKQRSTFRFVLSGGSTPRRLYEILAQTAFQKKLPWNQVHFFWGDERTVSPDHKDSNYRMARETLLSKLKIPAKNIHRIRAEAPVADTAARNYERTIKRHFGSLMKGQIPSFDLVLLGLGSDGHTASLFPGTPALKETRRWVVANPVPQFNSERLTLTPVILKQAFYIMFLVTGAEKAKVVHDILDGPADPNRLPAQLIHPVQGKMLWIMDWAAGSLLKAPKDPSIRTGESLDHRREPS